MKFSQIFGQERTKDHLRTLVEKDRVPHAMLLTGKQGSGKLAIALALASYLQCEQRSEGDSCGTCPSCKKAAGLVHPDIHYTMPTYSTGKESQPSSRFYEDWRSIIARHPYFSLNDWMNHIDAGTKQGNIPKVSLQELMRKFSLKIFEGKKKVSIIWRAELLQKEGNRLLKLIEEPPENSIFILIAEDLGKVLNTIISRCHVINVPPFSDEALAQYIKQYHPMDEYAAEMILQVANGNIQEVIMMAEDSNTALYDKLFDWLRLVYRAKSIDLVDWSNEFASLNKNDQKYFFKYALSFFEQFLLSHSLDRENLRISDEAYSTGQKMKAILNPEKTFQIIEILNDAIINTERNANVKLQMMNSSLTLHRIMTGK